MRGAVAQGQESAGRVPRKQTRPGRRASVRGPAERVRGRTAARAAGLRYQTDLIPGVRRLGSGPRFRYVGPNGRSVRDKGTLLRIRSLVIPPAWTDVWISPHADGHLQATGRDARGRKQYRYHPRWRATRDETKFDRMIAFGYALPAIRARVLQDLGMPGLPRPKVLAAVVQLLEKTLIRVGNDEYARDNGSYGLTTLRDTHVKVDGSRVRFSFRGKSGVAHALDVQDRRLTAIVRKCRDLPGQELFQYLDDEGRVQDVGSGDVNEYLRELTGESFTSKDFRTWAGTVLAAEALRACLPCRSKTEVRRKTAAAIDHVAARLGNTRAVCRKCYIHPAVVSAFEAGTLARAFARPAGRGRAIQGLGEAEVAILRLLERATSR